MSFLIWIRSLVISLVQIVCSYLHSKMYSSNVRRWVANGLTVLVGPVKMFARPYSKTKWRHWPCVTSKINGGGSGRSLLDNHWFTTRDTVVKSTNERKNRNWKKKMLWYAVHKGLIPPAFSSGPTTFWNLPSVIILISLYTSLTRFEGPRSSVNAPLLLYYNVYNIPTAGARGREGLSRKVKEPLSFVRSLSHSHTLSLSLSLSM